jgi:outer membrane lipoprotein-sorting protein
MLRQWVLALALLLPFSAQAAVSQTVLQNVEQYLSGITTIVADFTQVAPDGAIVTGKFYLKRPRKMRWQYNPPTPILMVTRGNFLTYYDYELNQVSDIPLDDTLLGFLSKPNITFKDPAIEVLDAYSEPGFMEVSVIQRGKPDEGKLTLQFDTNPTSLRNMIVTDATGQTTSVALENARFGASLDDDVFKFQDPRVGGKRSKKPQMGQ